MATNCGEPREVAWSSWGEWNYVRNLLYNFDDLEAMLKGVNMVNAWRSRLRLGSLPVSVELTATLVESYISHIYHVNDHKITDHQISLSIAMALVRFINGITDQLQTGLYAQSVQLIADKINIPEWMVDLRHQATHSQLPSLEVLLSGLVYSLSWLEKAYWKETSNALETKSQDLNNEFVKLLTDYCDCISSVLQSDILKSPSKTKVRKFKQSKMEQLTNNAQSLKKLINPSNHSLFLSIFNQQGFFVLNSHQLCNFQILSGKQLKFNFEKIAELSALWKPYFSAVSHDNPEFTKLLLDELISASNANQDQPELYLASILVLYHIDGGIQDEVIKYLFHHPSQTSYEILEDIFHSDDDTNKQSKQLFKIFKPIVQSLERSFPRRNLDVSVSESFQKCEEFMISMKQRLVSEKMQLKQDDGWQLCANISDIPAMGEFNEPNDLFYLDMSSNYVYSHPNVVIINKSTNNTNTIGTIQNLDNVIDELFVKNTAEYPTNPVDSDAEISSVTDDVIDFDIEKNETETFATKEDTNVENSIDASKISFF